jgi:hypothetical protein
MKQLKQTQKMRIIISGVAIYTTMKQLRGGMFGFCTQNDASFQAIAALENIRSGKGAGDKACCGLAGTWNGLPVQLDVL